MEAGKLRHKLTFEVNQGVGNDDFGEPNEDWVTDFEVMGAFEPLGSREFRSEWKINDETTARFRIRYHAGIDAARHRIVLNFDEYSSPTGVSIWDIYPPINVAGKRRELVIEARESR